MPLLVPTLVQGFLRMQRQYPANASDAAAQAADTYEAYARTATALGLLPILTGSEKHKVRLSLLQVWSSPSTASVNATANAWYRGVLQFWMSPPVQFGPGPFGPGVVIVPPSAVMAQCLMSINQPSRSEMPPIQRVAACLDSGTRMVQVQVPTVTTPIVVPLV